MLAQFRIDAQAAGMRPDRRNPHIERTASRMFNMDDTVARYSFSHAEHLLAMYERSLRGEHRLTLNETAEYRALLRRLRTGRPNAAA